MCGAEVVMFWFGDEEDEMSLSAVPQESSGERTVVPSLSFTLLCCFAPHLQSS